MPPLVLFFFRFLVAAQVRKFVRLRASTFIKSSSALVAGELCPPPLLPPLLPPLGPLIVGSPLLGFTLHARCPTFDRVFF